MGKRELLIITAFVAVGVIAYQFTAPPSTGTPRRFSLAAIVSTLRRNGRGNRSTGTFTHEGTIPANAALSEVLISNIGTLTIVGEARANIVYSLTIESGGPDAAAALAFAKRADLEQHDSGSALSLRPTFIPDARQTASLTIHMPARLAVRVEGAQNGGRLDVTGIAALRLDGLLGDVKLTDIAGGITGSHRNGDFAVTNAGSVNLTLVSSDLALTGVHGATTLIARNGHARLDKPLGPVDFDEMNTEITVMDPAASVHVNGTGGTITIERPRGEVKVDVHRSRVDVTLDAAVPTTVLTTDASLELELVGPPAVAIDATATDGGTIHADDFGLTPETAAQEVHLIHAFGRGSARVELLNARGEIVLRERK